jgi:hypothetical protein
MGLELTYDLIARRIDHSLLGPTLTDRDATLRLMYCSVCRRLAQFAIALRTDSSRDRARNRWSVLERERSIPIRHTSHNSETSR